MSKKLKSCPFCGSLDPEWKNHPEHCYLYMIQDQFESIEMKPLLMLRCREAVEEAWDTRTADAEIENKDWPTELWELFVEIDDVPKAMVVNDLRNYILGIQAEIVELKRRGKK